jgi:hypothetical protein
MLALLLSKDHAAYRHTRDRDASHCDVMSYAGAKSRTLPGSAKVAAIVSPIAATGIKVVRECWLAAREYGEMNTANQEEVSARSTSMDYSPGACMPQVSVDPALIEIWYALLAIAFANVAFGVGLLLVPRSFRWQVLPVVVSTMSIVTLTVIFVDMLPRVAAWSDGSDRFWYQAGFVFLAVGFGYGLHRLQGQFARRHPYAAGIVLLVIGISLALWTTAQTTAAELLEFDPTEMDQSSEVKPTQLVLYTDAGMPIRTYLARPLPAGERPQLQDDKNCARYVGKVINVAPSSYDSNCHGWVFAQGRCGLAGNDVRAILNDNEYQQVEAPAVGDLAVYWQGESIQHTGIVRLADASGFVLLESKWGYLGRYLHEPLVGPYPPDVRFYRTPRGTHLLRGITPAE